MTAERPHPSALLCDAPCVPVRRRVGRGGGRCAITCANTFGSANAAACATMGERPRRPGSVSDEVRNCCCSGERRSGRGVRPPVRRCPRGAEGRDTVSGKRRPAGGSALLVLPAAARLLLVLRALLSLLGALALLALLPKPLLALLTALSLLSLLPGL